MMEQRLYDNKDVIPLSYNYYFILSSTSSPQSVHSFITSKRTISQYFHGCDII